MLTLNVESTKRDDWKGVAGDAMTPLSPGTSYKTERYCRYYVARHHFTEALIRQYLADRRSWDWNKPLSIDQAKKLLLTLNEEDAVSAVDEGGSDDGENGAASQELLYVQAPNVPKEHVRELLRRLKDENSISSNNNNVIGNGVSNGGVSNNNNCGNIRNNDRHNKT